LGSEGDLNGATNLAVPMPSTVANAADLISSVDWGATPVGPESSWPQALKTAISICLDSRFPIVIFWGPDLIQFYNDAYAAVILREKHPAIGQRAQDCWAEIWPRIQPLLDVVTSFGRATYSEDLYLPVETDGEPQERYFTFSYSPIRTETGVAGVFCAVTETTERILRERESVHRADMLAELDRAKSSFFGNVSHEFRTPLTLMLGPLEEILASPRISGDDRMQLTVAHRNCLRLLKLVNALLDFTRADASGLHANFEATDLPSLTIDLSSNFRSACERAGLALSVDCPSFPEAVLVDRSMWETIVLNLLSNAFKFTLQGEIAVALNMQGSDAVLTVRDTGAGIPERDLPHIFERFYRSESVTGRTQEGSGIGLALVRELVRLHHGHIAVESVPGKGATFTVRIPINSARIPPALVAAPAAGAALSRGELYVNEALHWLPQTLDDVDSAKALAKPRVLLVDDNADMREYVRRLLSQEYAVETVADGREALARIRVEAPDVLVSDVMVPHLDGISLTKLLRQDRSLLGLPIILLSARAGDEARLEGLDAGADDYIVKPFKSAHLVSRVGVVVERVRRRGALDESSKRAADAAEESTMLSSREKQVLVRIAEGFSNKEIAGELGVSIKTIETYKARFSNKLGLDSRVAIVRYAVARGWLSSAP
jgi:signal transduction histidine kinase/DNA-binding NarL/FixJ family response regulator